MAKKRERKDALGMPLDERRRRRDARLQRMPEVVGLYLQGRNMLQISRKLNITYGQVRLDLETARKMWRRKAQKASQEYLAEELAKVNYIESKAWEGWERSVRDAVELQRQETKDGTFRRKTKKGQAGDARFLDTALRCVDSRCKLLKIGQYSSEEALKAQTRAVEIVVETVEQVNRILDYSEFEKISEPSDN